MPVLRPSSLEGRKGRSGGRRGGGVMRKERDLILDSGLHFFLSSHLKNGPLSP